MNVAVSPRETDFYFTIEKEIRTEIKVKGSNFIANAAPAQNKEKALDFLEKIRSEFFDATHNCFAYRIGFGGKDFRSSDDGEPSGSAGKPILSAIQGAELSDVIVVVTRYFGGTKLGVGGLVRAYGDASAEVLNIAERKIVHLTKSVRILCSYEEISVIRKMMEKTAVSFEENYSDSVEFIAEIPQSQAEIFAQQIYSATHGRAQASVCE